MTDRTPLKALYTGSTPTALGEFATGDTIPVANGGTGLTTPGASGNLLTSNGSAWVSSPSTGVSTGKAIAMAMIFGY